MTRKWTNLELVAVAYLAYRVLRMLRKFLRDVRFSGGFKVYFSARVFRILHKFVPSVQKEVKKESDKARADMEESLLKDVKDRIANNALPANSMPREQLLSLLQEDGDFEHKLREDPKFSGAIYHGGDELNDLMTEVYRLFSYSNPLHPDLFPLVRQMEAEVVRMCCSLFNGGEKSCGTMSAGGTESILLAVKAYRDWAYQEKGISEPEIIIPITAHAAFEKACHYFGIRCIHIPVDQRTFQATLAMVKKETTSNTIMIAGSAPCYPQGVIDPIKAISDFAESKNIPFHTDCCLGSFLLPFTERLKINSIPLFDFRLPGVTSISADTHKFGYAPKGSSVIMYSDQKYRRYQYFVSPEWTGGIYATPGFAGSRPGVMIALTWATMMHLGEEGYLESATQIMTTTKKIRDGVRSIKEIRILGNPKLSVLSFATTEKSGLNIYHIGEAMSKMGWGLNSLQNPPSFHLCVTHAHHDVADKFLDDLTTAVDQVKEDPSAFKSGSAAIYGTVETVPDISLIGSMVSNYVDILYQTGYSEN